MNHNITITNTDPSKKNVYPWWPEDIGYQFLLSIHIHATKEFTLCRAFGYHKHKFLLKIDQGFLITPEAINIRNEYFNFIGSDLSKTRLGKQINELVVT